MCFLGGVLWPTELWLSLEEHQYALELIMARYRKQMLQMMMGKKELDTKPVLLLHQDHAKVGQEGGTFLLEIRARFNSLK